MDRVATAPSRINRLLRGLLLILTGAVLGAVATYVALGQQCSMRGRPPEAPAVVPAPVDPATPPAQPMGSQPRITSYAATPDTTAPVPPPDTKAPAAGLLLIPVQGVGAAQLSDTFSDARSGGRVHDAIDIMAPAGTPVVAAADGTVAKLFNSKLGGITLYQFAPDGETVYYYAHLASYAPGIREGMQLARGQVLGQVGSTGDASPDAPHLHFAISRMGPEHKWWKGEAINPYPLLTGKPPRLSTAPAPAAPAAPGTPATLHP